MSKKGGYKIIDFKNTPIKTDGTVTKIPEIFEAVKENYNKPCLITGFNVNGETWRDFFVTFIPSGDTVFNAFILYASQIVFVLTVMSDGNTSINQINLTVRE